MRENSCCKPGIVAGTGNYLPESSACLDACLLRPTDECVNFRIVAGDRAGCQHGRRA